MHIDSDMMYEPHNTEAPGYANSLTKGLPYKVEISLCVLV